MKLVLVSPSDPETPEPFNSPFQARNPELSSYSDSPQSLGSVCQNLGPGHIYPKMKSQCFFLRKWRMAKYFLILTFQVKNTWEGREREREAERQRGRERMRETERTKDTSRKRYLLYIAATNATTTAYLHRRSIAP